MSTCGEFGPHESQKNQGMQFPGFSWTCKSVVFFLVQPRYVLLTLCFRRSRTWDVLSAPLFQSPLPGRRCPSASLPGSCAAHLGEAPGLLPAPLLISRCFCASSRVRFQEGMREVGGSLFSPPLVGRVEGWVFGVLGAIHALLAGAFPGASRPCSPL